MQTIKILPWIFTIIIIDGCRKDYPFTKSPDPNPIPKEISFKNEIFPVFTQTCMGSTCHDTYNPELTNLSIAYSALLNNSAATSSTPGRLVDLNNPMGSILYIRLTSYSPDAIMPPGSALSGEFTQKVLDWIKQGAKNN